MVRRGEEVLVTDRGEVVAGLRQPVSTPGSSAYPGLARHVRAGRARLGAPNSPSFYPRITPPVPSGSAALLGRNLVAEMEVLALDKRIRDNARVLGFDTLPES